MTDFSKIIDTGIQGLTATLKNPDAEGAQEQAVSLALSLLAVFLQNQNRIANALDQLATESKLRGMAHAVVKPE